MGIEAAAPYGAAASIRKADMKSRQPQPAKKSYFFGQGFKDIHAAIKKSWQKNKQTAQMYYSRYSAKGLMSFKGIFNLFCALAVITFGTFFFVIISTLMLLVVSAFFLIVYLGFTLVWLFDRLYLIRKRIFTACNECKNRFLIPTYICPECGVQHTNLTPGVYGIFSRTCNCGKKLPTAFFNGRKQLRAICPYCLKEGRTTVLSDRESRPLCVPVVGGRSVGKTAYITAFSKLFVEEVAPNKGLEIEFYNEAKKDIFTDIKLDYAHGSTRMTVRPNDITKTSSVSFSFFVKHKKLKPERLLHIYDIAGEVFTDNSENEVQKQYEYCQGIILIIDPFSIPTVRAHYDALLSPEDRAGIGKADINGIIDVFLNKLREVTGLSDRKMSTVPMAILFSKTDSAGLAAEFSPEKVAGVRKNNQEESMDDSDAIDYLCREFLKTNNMGGFLNTIDMKFTHNRFFAVSAIGHKRDAGQYTPHYVLEPMEWISSLADKQFAKLWVEHKYSKRSNYKQLEGGDI